MSRSKKSSRPSKWSKKKLKSLLRAKLKRWMYFARKSRISRAVSLEFHSKTKKTKKEPPSYRMKKSSN